MNSFPLTMCLDCKWSGEKEKREIILEPKRDVVFFVCPSCGRVENFVYVCSKKGCKEPVTCGTATKEGYKLTCGKHLPQEKDLKSLED